MSINRIGTALLAAAAMFAPALRVGAQTKCLPGDIEKYAAKASSRSDVNLDRTMLGFAGNFLNQKDGNEAEAKQAILHLNAIVVHSYEFDEPGAYSVADVDSIRSQYKGPEWSHIVSTSDHPRGRPAETSDIWMHIVDGKSTGMVILSAEEKELSFVCIDGVLDPGMLSHLSGQFGVPQVNAPSGNGSRKLVAPDDNASSGPGTRQ